MHNFWNEVWKPVEFNELIHEDERYKISNYGRLIRYREGKEVLFNPYLIHGYYYFKVKHIVKGKYKTFYVHKLVAQHFIEQNDGIAVVHLDYDKKNNYVGNLKWVTKREKEIHQFSNPEYKKSSKFNSAKLTENRVRLLKKILNDPNRKTRLKILAKQFGVTTMQLHRIKSGENWGDVPSL